MKLTAASRNDSRSFYRIVRDITGSRTNSVVFIKNKSGKILLSDEEQLDRWVEHFTEVLNQPIPSSTFDLQDEIANELDVPSIDFSKAKIESALRDLPNNKAAGIDHFPAELLKSGGDEMMKELTNIANIIWQTNGRLV